MARFDSALSPSLCRAGEEIEVTGIYTHSYDLGLSQKSGFPVFGTLIEANYIQKRQDQFSVHRLTDDDRREILALARDPQVRLPSPEPPPELSTTTYHAALCEIPAGSGFTGGGCRTREYFCYTRAGGSMVCVSVNCRDSAAAARKLAARRIPNFRLVRFSQKWNRSVVATVGSCNMCTGISSVQPQCPTEPYRSVRYGRNTLPNSPVWFSTSSIPVPDTSVASVRPPKIPRVPVYPAITGPVASRMCYIRGHHRQLQSVPSRCAVVGVPPTQDPSQRVQGGHRAHWLAHSIALRQVGRAAYGFKRNGHRKHLTAFILAIV